MDYIEGRATDIVSINSALSDIEELKVAKQDKLINGETIKTVNGQSILGMGNLNINDTLDLDLVVNHTVGGLQAGRTLAAGTTLEEILRLILS